uniref:Uncharacterized protein n=1 Tax=Triticum urartu TaxID=4572 RepID=A0A8R7V178_TRIUA
MEEREVSPAVTEAYVLTTFCGGSMACWLPRSVLTMPCCRRGLFFLPPPDLRTSGAKIFDAEKTNDGDVGELACPMGGPGEGKKAKPPLSVEPVRACFGEGKDATAHPPWYSLGDRDGSVDKDARPPPAGELAGVSGCSGEAENMNPPLAVGPAVGFCGESMNVSPPLKVPPVGVVGCPGGAKNDRALTPEPVGDGVLGVSSKNAKMLPPLPPPLPPIHGRTDGNEKSPAGDPVRDSKGGAVLGERRGEGGCEGEGEESKGWSSTSNFLRGETGGRRQRRLRPPGPATPPGAEKVTAECWGSMRSSARWCGDGARKKLRWRSAAIISIVGAPEFFGSCVVVAVVGLGRKWLVGWLVWRRPSQIY